MELSIKEMVTISESFGDEYIKKVITAHTFQNTLPSSSLGYFQNRPSLKLIPVCIKLQKRNTETQWMEILMT